MLISGALYLISAGSSDFVQNYYINPYLNRNITPDQFSNTLIQSFSAFIQTLYGLGARRIGVTSLPPLGCLPASVTLFGGGSNQCVARLNQDATSFNNKLTATTQTLLKRFSGLKMVVFDIYKPLYDMVIAPSNNGFMEARRACCGTGTIETSLLVTEYPAGLVAVAVCHAFTTPSKKMRFAKQYHYARASRNEGAGGGGWASKSTESWTQSNAGGSNSGKPQEDNANDKAGGRGGSWGSKKTENTNQTNAGGWSKGANDDAGGQAGGWNQSKAANETESAGWNSTEGEASGGDAWGKPAASSWGADKGESGGKGGW